MSIGLLAVLLLAKAAMLSGHAPSISVWAMLAYVWQDVLIATAFGMFQWALARLAVSRWIVIAVYYAVVAYAAISIPIERTLATPLTWPMLRAARGPLSDSAAAYVTATNVGLIAAALALVALTPIIIRRIRPVVSRIALICAVPILLLGPFATDRVDAAGLGRNAFTALFTLHLSSVSASAPINAWSASIFSDKPTEDLSQYSGAAKGMNVVMVSLESTAAQYLSIYGAKENVTPHLAALAQHALVFDNAYAAYPESIKGLYSVLCSTFPAFDTQPEQYEKLGCRSIADVLASEGYRTALFHSGRFDYLGMQSIVQHRGFQTLEDAGDIGGNHRSSFGVDEPATVDRMLRWIDSLPRAQKFFLHYLPIAGHHPYATPSGGPFSGPEEIDQYRNALHYGDESIGALLLGLRERGLEDNTLWIVYGDHGEAFRQHPNNVAHTFFIYEENIHVPLIIANPKRMQEQKHITKLASLVDTAPTLLDLTGLPHQPLYQGQTLLDLSSRMALFFTDYSLGLLGLRDGPWKLIYETASGRAKLYNLNSDPHELTDIASREPARVKRYIDIVRGWSSAQQSYVAHSGRP